MCVLKKNRLIKIKYVAVRAALILILPTTAAKTLAQVQNTNIKIPQSIEQNVIDKVNVPLNNSLNSIRQKIERQQAEKRRITAEKLKTLQPATHLASVLPIISQQKKLLFKDVAVENNWRAIEQQWLLTIKQDELTQLKAFIAKHDMRLVAQKLLPNLQLIIVNIHVAQHRNSFDTMFKLIPKIWQENLTRNYVYASQFTANNHPDNHNANSIKSNAICQNPLRIGVVDTAIDLNHVAFKQSKVIEKSFIDNTLTPPKAHGTAVSALLVSSAPELPALLPNATLYSAQAFYAQNDYAQAASLYHLVSALDWLVENQVDAINLSLAGPNTPLLAQIINKMSEKNIIMVAAVGNEGPNAPPMYPAAYDNVIGVTAIDNQDKHYRWANRGDYVGFSALGVSVKTARAGGSFSHETGTSIATPFVTAFAACAKKKTKNYLDALQSQAIDLGEQGRDNIFGYGKLSR